MIISGLKINNVRNHIRTEIALNEGLNVFYGLNGSGKTSILESAAISGFSKSFLPCADGSLIKQGEDFYSIQANAVNNLTIPYNISVSYENGKRKKINSSKGDNMLPKDIIGDLPMVILSPDYKAITFGAPESRRSFIDRLLSQSSRLYIEELYKYKRALKQRNSLLNSSKSDRNFDYAQINPWTETLIKSGSEIINRRMKFISEFRPVFKKYYLEVSQGKEEVELEYLPYGFSGLEIPNKADSIERILRNLFIEHRNDEYARGITLYGPQKDDLKIIINGGTAKEFASQGQHKSLLISIKLAEFSFLLEKKNETPVVLLDDIFSELDEQRIKKVFELIWESSAQTFVTVTEPDSLRKIIGNSGKCSFFEVKKGIVKKDLN